MACLAECWWFLTTNNSLLCMSREAWAAWIQAIGTIAAIAIPAVIAQRQYKRQLSDITAQSRSERINELKKSRALVAICGDTAYLVASVPTDEMSRKLAVSYIRRIGFVTRQLEKSTLALPNYMAVTHLSNLLSRCVEIQTLLDDSTKTDSPALIAHKTLVRDCEGVTALSSLLRTEIEEEIERLESFRLVARLRHNE